ncbi:MAG: hypothetical protein NC181_04720 [Clostridium sp.]|nr:hypothetical protein [Clostridium sp.]MCM1444605.1 hypothetical protein [Candidatus Amulumruptor caecigallinarius]
MKELIIKKYIDNITKSDIYNFGVKNNIILDDKELDIIYYYIKKDWKVIIFGNINPILNELKEKVNTYKLTKIVKLYNEFKEKYKNFL